MATQAAQTAQAVDQILSHTHPSYAFTFSPFLLQTYRIGLSPDRPICRAYIAGHCPNGTACLDRHISGTTSAAAAGKPPHVYYGSGSGPNSLVCKHWLRGLCKKGEQCEFLHEYNLRKMPECNFFLRNGFCSNGEECLYLHVDPRSRLPPCPAYERGFCPLGPECPKKHLRRRVCLYYLAGFCPDGPACREGSHPKWKTDEELKEEEEAAAQKMAAAAAALEKTQQDGEGPDSVGRTEELRDKARDRERDRDDGRGFGRGGKWRGKTDRRFRGRGGY